MRDWPSLSPSPGAPGGAQAQPRGDGNPQFGNPKLETPACPCQLGRHERHIQNPKRRNGGSSPKPRIQLGVTRLPLCNFLASKRHHLIQLHSALEGFCVPAPSSCSAFLTKRANNRPTKTNVPPLEPHYFDSTAYVKPCIMGSSEVLVGGSGPDRWHRPPGWTLRRDLSASKRPLQDKDSPSAKFP